MSAATVSVRPQAAADQHTRADIRMTELHQTTDPRVAVPLLEHPALCDIDGTITPVPATVINTAGFDAGAPF